jgi:phage terminase large subunit-like protein
MRWSLEWFIWFAELLTLPVVEVGYTGPPKPLRLEPFQRFILKMAFKTGRAELLVLLPKGNGKTLLFAALAVFHLLVTDNAECFIGAADGEQAKTMYRFASHFIDSEPELEARLELRKSTREIRSKRDQGFIKVLASDQSKQGGKRHSYNPSLALIDELHAHENDSLYTALRSATFKRGGLVITISTAGHDEETSVLGIKRAKMYDYETTGGKISRELKINARGLPQQHKDGRLTIIEAPSGNTCMLEWACNSDDDLDDMEVVKLANPASFVTIAGLEDGHETLEPSTFQRYRANVWAQAADAIIKAPVWDGMDDGSTIPVGEPRYVIVDYAQKSDGCAVTQLYLDEERGKLIPKAHVWARRIKVAGRPQPAAHELVDEETIRQSLVRAHIRKINETEGEVLGVIYDPHLFDPEELEDEGFFMIEFPQRLSRQIPASKKLYDIINEDGFRHDGDPVLRSHVLSAAAIPAGEGWRFSKAKSKKLIDACICLQMGVEEVLDGGGTRPFIAVLA